MFVFFADEDKTPYFEKNRENISFRVSISS